VLQISEHSRRYILKIVFSSAPPSHPVSLRT
jgi:hypothetical protein